MCYTVLLECLVFIGLRFYGGFFIGWKIILNNSLNLFGSNSKRCIFDLSNKQNKHL